MEMLVALILYHKIQESPYKVADKLDWRMTSVAPIEILLKLVSLYCQVQKPPKQMTQLKRWGILSRLQLSSLSG